MVELDELFFIFTFVDTVCEKSWEGFGVNDGVIVGYTAVIGNDSVGVVVKKGYSPHVGAEVLPTLEDGFPIKRNFTAS